MKKILSFVLIAAVASLLAFVMHVFAVEWLNPYISEIMAGRNISPSWDVRYVAAVTSIEMGLGALLVYVLLQRRFPSQSPWLKGLCLAVVLLMVKGQLLRQGLMNYWVGNPLTVVLVQDGITWLIWLVMCVFIAVAYDYFKLA